MIANLAPVAGPRRRPPSPAPERCQPAPMCRKGKPVRRCGPCSLASLRARHRAYDAAHQQRKAELRRCGGIACPPYVAWTVYVYSDGVCELYGQPGRDGSAALVLPAYGACSCGQAGCVHLVVACLAQQEQGGGDDG